MLKDRETTAPAFLVAGFILLGIGFAQNLQGTAKDKTLSFDNGSFMQIAALGGSAVCIGVAVIGSGSP
jgi:hypothetical protein